MGDVELEITNHLRRLCVEIGPRPIASPGNRAAADYVEEVFRAAGLTVGEQRFACPDWQEEETCLELAGARLVAAANAFSPSGDAAGRAVAAGTVAELQAADLAGRIGILYGDLTTAPLAPKGCTVYNPERDQLIVRLLEEKRPAALVTVNPQLGCLTRIIEDWELAIPSATVPAEVGLTLLNNLDRPLRLRIATRREPSHSANVVGRKAGTRPERVVLCAHYDTRIDTPGAVDNGAGVAALLTLAGLLASRPLDVGLELVAFSAEEYSGLCDSEYVRHSGAELGSVLAAVNMDGIGYQLGATTVAMMAHSDDFRAAVAGLVAPHRGVVWTPPWPESNHSTFAWRGVPSVAFSSNAATSVSHLPADTVEWVSVGKVAEVVGLVAGIVEGLEGRPLDWTREPKAEG